MTNQRQTDENIHLSFKRFALSLQKIVAHETFILLLIVFLGFATATVSLLGVNVTPSTDFGESVEKVLPPSYWLGIATIIVAISYMLRHPDKRKITIPFIVACMMLIFLMRSVLAILSPLPPVPDAWVRMVVIKTWMKNGLLSKQGLPFFAGGYVRGWPLSFILAYLIVYAGVPMYTFFTWSPTIIFMLEVIAIYFLFKELANQKIGLVSAFLFTLHNTNSFFTLHYTAQGLGALFYLVAMYITIKAYKTKKLKHLALAFITIFVVVITHHMTTLYLGISIIGAYLSRDLLQFLQKINTKKKRFPFTVKSDTFVKLSLPLCLFVFALWYFYGFIVYPIDARAMLTDFVRLLTTGQPQYSAGFYYYYVIQPPLSRLAVAIPIAFVLGTGTLFLAGKMWRREPLEGHLWFAAGWTGIMILTFLVGNVIYGNYIEPSRSRDIICVAFYPASASFLLRIFESKSSYKKILMTIVLIVVAFFSLFSIYRGAQDLVYFTPHPILGSP